MGRIGRFLAGEEAGMANCVQLGGCKAMEGSPEWGTAHVGQGLA